MCLEWHIECTQCEGSPRSHLEITGVQSMNSFKILKLFILHIIDHSITLVSNNRVSYMDCKKLFYRPQILNIPN